MSIIRIGNISYTNVWPVSHYFNKDKFNNKVEFVPQVPSQLNKQMAEGLIDLGPISSFSYAEHADQYMLLPNLSVSAYGNVGSILLFLKDDITTIANKKVALSNTSATSVNLLKIILEKFFGGKPEYITMPPKIDMMMDKADAALLIGDEAILANWKNNKNNRYQIKDLGEEWLKRTSHWMTFAVWAVRKDILTKAPKLLYEIYQEFSNSKNLGKEKVSTIINESVSRFGGSYQYWENYFAGLNHDFTKDHIAGLNHYYTLANEIGNLERVPTIEVVNFAELLNLKHVAMIQK